ncbi:helix-turn-helix domain-containing protein [Magnetofaba australis]|uniref:helix-turn-helix domain-containing protein n=1 Tax=Magnetofaba australis TaxID=1472297 RepID=UPI000A19C483|nr:helix-turn-helix domain-containing protein [Magnetofaba australis]
MKTYQQTVIEPELITPREAAKILGVEPTTLGNWRHTKRYPLPYVKVGKKVMYRLTDVEEFIESRYVTH